MAMQVPSYGLHVCQIVADDANTREVIKYSLNIPNGADAVAYAAVAR